MVPVQARDPRDRRRARHDPRGPLAAVALATHSCAGRRPPALGRPRGPLGLRIQRQTGGRRILRGEPRGAEGREGRHHRGDSTVAAPISLGPNPLSPQAPRGCGADLIRRRGVRRRGSRRRSGAKSGRTARGSTHPKTRNLLPRRRRRSASQPFLRLPVLHTPSEPAWELGAPHALACPPLPLAEAPAPRGPRPARSLRRPPALDRVQATRRRPSEAPRLPWA